MSFDLRFVGALVVSFVLALLVTRWLVGSARRAGLVDVPNARSLHQRPTPRGGGAGVLSGLGLALLLLPASPFDGFAWVAAGVLLLAAVSLFDDVRALPPLPRIGVHLAAAGAAVAGGVAPSAVGLPGMTLALDGAALAGMLSLLFTVWMLNLYNFMDGMDGFAGGMTVSGFGSLALLGFIGGDAAYAAFAAVVAAAAAGFLVLNFPPARIFMGDVGSVPLGFLAAAMILVAERDGLFPFWLGVLVFSPFVVDATFTLLRRLLAGERVWQAHRSHLYQRLVQAGWSHRRTVLAEYALMLACAASALVVAAEPGAGPAIGVGWVVGYTAAVVIVTRYCARGRRAPA